MKRYLVFVYFMLLVLSVGFSQSGKIIDDIYVTPNDVQMVNEVKAAQKVKERKETQPAAIYRNGAKEIVFIDSQGNRTTAVSDTVYIVEGEVYADSIADDQEEGYYLNGFKGSQSDFEYAERIRRFHNPKYTITIADPGYNDIYFLDDDYWNVYIDGMYATITPTWTNPYYWNYQWQPYSYNSWAWRYNWGYPSWSSYYGWGGWYNSWYSPWYSGYYGWGGWYDPWYSPWYSGYYGYYGGWGGYYGWGYPYYGYYGGWGYPYYYGGYYNYGSKYDMSSRRSLGSSRRYDASGLTTNRSRSAAVNSSGRSGVARSSSNYTRVSTERNASSRNEALRRGSASSRATSGRTAVSSGIDTRTRTGTVRSPGEWNNIRDNRTYSTSGDASGRSSTIINRTNPSSGRASSTQGSTGSTDTRRSSATYDTSTRSSSRSSSYDNSRSSSRSYDSGRSSSTYSSPSRSSGSSFGGSSSYGGGGSSRSSSSGGSRR